MPAPFDLPFVQRAVLELVALSLAAGIVGTFVVLRGLAFYTHAVGTAAFPGLVVADGLGIAAALGAAGTAGLVAVAVALLVRRRPDGADTATALVLVAALALGVVLASDVFASQARVEQLLFGSLLLVDGADIALAATASAAALAGTAVLGRHWLARGFEPRLWRAPGLPAGAADAALLALVALTALAALSAVGALLATALLVVPAATARLVCERVPTWRIATVALVLVEGVAGLWLAVELNAPPGATIAVVAGGVFAIVAAGRALRTHGVPAPAAAIAVAVLALAGCGGGGGSGDAAGGDRPAVLATTPVVADLARQVGGQAIDVRQLLAPNTDPHDYEPRPDDVRAASGAALVLRSGLGLDAFAGQLVEAAGDPPVLDLGAELPVTVRGEGGEPDPHWWHSPRNAVAAVEQLAARLAGLAPRRAAGIRARARRYAERILATDRRIAACLRRIPRTQRRLVTDHDAFGHLARHYGLTIVGAVIPSLTTAAQPSAGDLAALARTIRREKVRAVFPETSVNQRLAREIARRTGARVGKPLYADTLGPRGSAGATYLGALAHNARALAEGLSGGAVRCDGLR